jgi:hypothetical protein
MSRAMGPAHTYPSRRHSGRALRRSRRALGAITVFFTDFGAQGNTAFVFFGRRRLGGTGGQLCAAWRRAWRRLPGLQRAGAAGRVASSSASNKRAEHVVISGTGQRSRTASTSCANALPADVVGSRAAG